MSIPTPHIEVKDKDLFAKTVLMPGDPLRAKFIAEKYLENVVQVNGVRNMFGYTGYYKGKKVTVMGSGMGQPSIGIYSYELFNFYDVDTIIRIGSAGAYTSEANVYDVVIATSAYSESSFAEIAYGYKEHILEGNKEVNAELEKAAKELGYDVIKARIHSSDVFYRHNGDIYEDVVNKYNCTAVEMESFALFANAKYANKKAACVLTISDSFVTKEVTTAEERQNSFNKMMEIALTAAK